MVGSTVALNSAVFLLRSNNDYKKANEADVDALINIARQAGRSASLPGSYNDTVASSPSGVDAGSPTGIVKPEPETLPEKVSYAVYGKPLYGKYKGDHAYGAQFESAAALAVRHQNPSLWYTLTYGSEAVLAPESARRVNKGSFASNVVIATTLKTAENQEWENARKLAIDKIATAVGAVLAYNSPHHVLSQIDPEKSNLDTNEVIHANNRILTHNSRTSGGFGRAGYNRTDVDRENVERTGDDRMELKPHQIKSDDGRVLAELDDKGHLITYNEDGSVNEEYNRAQTGYLAAQKNPEAEYICLAAYTMKDEELDFY